MYSTNLFEGELIAQGDPKHIVNFLQLLYEISKMFLQRMQNEEGKQQSSVCYLFIP